MVNIEKRLKLLQAEVGKKPKIEVGEFQNWDTTRKIKKLLTCSPKSLDEVQTVVKAAKKLELRVRCTGAGHSWAPLFPDEGNILMKVKDIKRHDGPQIELKREGRHNYVTVMSGITVGELMKFELEEKVNLPCNVILTEPMYGGVVGAGCHGVGWNFKAIPDYVIRMRIVDSEGELRTYTLADNPEMFQSIRTNLGLFGVMYDMTFDLIDEAMAKAENEFHHKVEDIFYDPKYLKNLVKSNESVEIFWWPFNSIHWDDAIDQIASIIGIDQKLTREQWDPKKDRTWVKKVNLLEPGTYDKKDVTKNAYYKTLDVRTWLESESIQVADKFIVHCPQEVTPLYLKAAFKFLKETNSETLIQPLPHAVHYRPNIAIFSVHDMEFCFNVNDDFSVVTRACQDVIEIVQDYAEDGKFPLNIALEMRWMANTDATLCPAFIGNPKNGGSGHVVYIEVLSYTNTPHWKQFCEKVFKKWRKLNPTIHWAKEWELLDEGVDYMKQVFSKQAKKFAAQLDASKADPTGVFTNDRLMEILLPGREYPEYDDPEEEKRKKKKRKSSTCVVL